MIIEDVNKSNHPVETRRISHANPGYVTILSFSLQSVTYMIDERFYCCDETAYMKCMERFILCIANIPCLNLLRSGGPRPIQYKPQNIQVRLHVSRNSFQGL